MTIWLFGDSFALMNWERKADPRSWPYLLSNKLNQEIEIMAKGGTGPEWMFYTFNSFYEKFKPNDIIIICFSSENRHWYLFHEPQITHMHMVDRILTKKDSWLKITAEEAQAIELHSLYLQNPAVLETSTQFFLRVLNNLAKEKNIKPIIMSFSDFIKDSWKSENSNCCFVDGTLFKASIDEFQKNELAPMGDDYRAGHFSYRNHVTLANKLEQCVLNGTNFHLNQDLLKGFIGEREYADPAFRLKEFIFDPKTLKMLK